MAIVTETFEIKGREFVRTYSDSGRYVVGGSPEGQYTEAVDPAEFGRVYTEGNLIEDDALPDDYEQALAEMGVRFGD